MRRKYHVRHVSAILAVLYGVAVATYVACEHHTLGDSLWWAFTTFTTVGYGDQYPRTVPGRLAGMALVSSAVFVVVPAMTARVVTRFMHDENEWTHDEQEEVKKNLRTILNLLTQEQN